MDIDIITLWELNAGEKSGLEELIVESFAQFSFYFIYTYIPSQQPLSLFTAFPVFLMIQSKKDPPKAHWVVEVASRLPNML